MQELHFDNINGGQLLGDFEKSIKSLQQDYREKPDPDLPRKIVVEIVIKPDKDGELQINHKVMFVSAPLIASHPARRSQIGDIYQNQLELFTQNNPAVGG